MRLSAQPVTLRQWQYVVAVADRRSFRRAAEDCSVAQPSLSAQISQAEGALGVQLFERDKRTVVLTTAGAALVERARALLIAADELVDAAGGLSDPFTGTLRLGVIPTVAPYLLPEVAPLLRERHPRLSFQWTEERSPNLLADLSKAELDGAIVALEEVRTPDLARCILGKDPFVVAAARSHPLASGDRPLRPEDLDGQSVLLLDDGHCFRDQALAVCSKGGAHEAAFRARSLTTLVQMAAGSDALTLLPRLALPIENRRQDLAVRPFGPKGPARTLALVWRKAGARGKTMRPIGEALRDAFTDAADWPTPDESTARAIRPARRRRSASR